MASAGIASRRKCETIIEQGRVTVNGKTSKLGESADPAKDKILVDRRPLKLEKKVYIILNKPRGYVTTVSEEHGMKTIMDLIQVNERVFPVGRLDKDTEGILLLTNDGELALKLTHPRFGVEKEYIAKLNKEIKSEDLEKIKQATIEGRQIQIKNINLLNSETVQLTIHEGRKHIVKRIFESLDYWVLSLKRIRFGPLQLDNLGRGRWRFLTNTELRSLIKL